MSVKHVIELTEETFSEQVSSGVVLVDFWAPWCGPCRMLGPTLEQVALAVDGTATVAKVNVDSAPQLAAAFGIRSIPALFVIRDGQVVEQLVGVQSKDRLISLLQKHAATAESTA